MAAQPPAHFQGAIVGEIRIFSFGSDTEPTAIWDGTALVVKSLRALGWISCEGQGLDDDQFPELANLYKSPAPPTSTQSIWGSSDVQKDFSIPDLRGMFLRGFMPSVPVPPNPAGEPADPINDVRIPPRPDYTGPGSNTGTATPQGVGSFQRCAIESHDHTIGDYVNTGQFAAGGFFGFWAQPGHPYFTQGTYSSGVSTETRPANVHVMYCVWTGRVVIGANVTNDDKLK